MTDTLPWIIAGACALWGAVATIMHHCKRRECLLEARLREKQEEHEQETWIKWQRELAKNDQLRARIEAARKALEEEG